jgi:CRP/FNR family transcriptional regulator, cyclic AMP receptor protein
VIANFRAVPILAGLNEAALELLAGRARDSTFAAGALVVGEGETGNRFFVILSGEVRVCKRLGRPGEVELARLARGEFFGEMCILETLPRSASVVALTEARLASLSSMDFLQLYNRMPDQYGILVLNLARDLSRRLRRLDEAFAARH